jgi:hypothetical protein
MTSHRYIASRRFASGSLVSTFASTLVAGLVMSFSSTLAAQIRESQNNEIGYATVAEALATLRGRPDVQISQQGGWTIVSDSVSSTIWSFTPSDHPAYPSAVKRSVVSRDGSTYMDMKVLCESTKTACDKLVVDFQQLNQRATASIAERPSASAAQNQGSQRAPADAKGSLESINVTSDSAPGWLPSAEQRAQVPQITQEFLAALDSGLYAKAFRLMTEGQRSQESFDKFSARVKEFNAKAGAVTERRILKVTWTKDPANAPAPGVYASVDLASHFERVDRHCGYIVLYQLKAGMPFLVARQEDNFITNEQANQMATKQSPQSVDEIWNRLSRNCPNFATATSGKST